MKVILLQDIEKLGKIGEVREVSAGYARNFLIPKKLVKLATAKALKEVETLKLVQEQKAKLDLEATQKIVESLDGFELIIKTKIKEEGKLFGSITDSMISKELKKEGFDIGKNQVKLSEPIKEVGDYEILISFDHGLEANIKVSVIGE